MQNVKSPVPAEYLESLFAAATQEASAAMCQWTGSQISMQLESVRVLPLECVADEYDLGNDLLALVVLSLDAGASGELILVFDPQSARELAASLLSRTPGQSVDWSPLEQSALMETGNILACAYTNAIARLIDVQLVPSPPTFLEDYAASVLEQALATQAMTSDDVMICRTRFEAGGKALDWSVFFIPSAELREAITRAADR